MASSTAVESTKTAAELMQEQHEAAEHHHATVEDTVDEDDILHPPPSHAVPLPDRPVNGLNKAPMSAKAAGKQKAQDTPGALDTASEEAFPALGGGSKVRPAAAPSSWGGKAPISAMFNGSSPAASHPSSPGASTPTSSRGGATPIPPVVSSGKPQQFGQAPQELGLPGRYRYEFEISNAEVDKEKLSSQAVNAMAKKNGVSIFTRSVNYGGSTRFIIEGSKTAVEKVAHRVSEEFTLKVKKKIEIPSSLKSVIIGRGGSNIELLEKKHKVKIQVPDRKDNASDTAVVEIAGNAASVRSAEEAIMRIVKERQPKVDLPLQGVPPHVHPFIARRHAPDIQRWEQDHDLRVDIPPFQLRQSMAPSPALQSLKSPTITVSGDLPAARQAHAELSQFAQLLEQQLKRQEHTLPRSVHPFIVGERGMSQEEFLEETGCVLILPDDGSEDVIVIGPEDCLQTGADKAIELAGRVKRETVDVHKPFANSPRGSEVHSRAFQRYLHDRQVFEELRQRHNADVVFPGNLESSTSWTVVADDNRSVLQGRSELLKIIGAYPPERLSIVDVDPFFHPHLPTMCAADLRNDLGVHMVVPDSGEDHVILVYEGVSGPDMPFEISRQKPTPEQINDFETALRQANNRILSIIGDSTIEQRHVEIPSKYHDDVRRFTERLPRPDGPGNLFPVQVEFASSLPPTRLSAASDGVIRPEDLIFLRGQGEDAVEELRKLILEELQELQENEKLRNHKIAIEFPDKLKDRLVGKQGAQVNELRKKYGVEIETKLPGIVQIRGPPKLAEPCKAEIIRLQHMWAEEAVYHVKVDPKHVGSIIGRGGENLERLRKKGKDQVTILAPPNGKSDDSQSIADTASDVGSTRPLRAKDEFVIRGPRQLAAQIKAEIEDLHAHIKETSYEASVTVARSQIPSLIGRSGSEIEKLRLETGARIDLPKPSSTDDASERVVINIRGSKQAVEKAKAEIQKRSKAFDDIVTRKIEIDQKHHQILIGPHGEFASRLSVAFTDFEVGSNLQRIIQDAGAPSAEAVQFPKKGAESNTVTITAPTQVADKLVTLLQAVAAEKADEVTESVDVPVDKHRLLVGPGGETRRALESEYKVRVNVPRQNSGNTTVKITGGSSNVEKAKEEILRRTTRQPGETILVPLALHHDVSDYGRLFRHLKSRNVIVDHGGHQPPPKPENGASTSQNLNGDMPLITDSPDNLAHSWKLVSPQVEARTGDETIPWILTGPPDAVAAAKSQIERRLTTVPESKSTGYLKLSDPSLHRHIIGRAGSKINEIRKESGCNIQVPSAQSGGDGAITITGTPDGCEVAKQLILEAVERAGADGNGSGSF